MRYQATGEAKPKRGGEDRVPIPDVLNDPKQERSERKRIAEAEQD